MTDRERLLQAIVGVFTYYEKEASEFVMNAWVEDLGGFPVADVEAALVRHRRDPQRGQWAPKTADILRQLHGDASEDGHLAWSQLLTEIRRVGSYGKPRLDESAMRAVHAIGGWGVLCHSQEKDLPFLQRRFMDAFGVYAARLARGDGFAAMGNNSTARLQ